MMAMAFAIKNDDHIHTCLCTKKCEQCNRKIKFGFFADIDYAQYNTNTI